MMDPVARFALFASLLLFAGEARSGEDWPFFGWTISASPEDPFVPTAAPVVGSDSLFLWVACTADTADLGRDRFNSAEFHLTGTLSGIDGLPIGVNGALWLRKNPSRLLMAIGGCPTGPLLVGILPVTDDGSGGTACFEPSGWGFNITVDCSDHVGQPRENDYVGFASDGTEPCRSSPEFCPTPISIEDVGWGDVKARYR
jgi:hypothetical protein